MYLVPARTKDPQISGHKISVRFVILILGIFMLPLPAIAQGSFGTILGTVTDATGAVIVGAKVTITDTMTGVSRTQITSAVGGYNAPNLVPDSYLIKVHANGFKVYVRQGISLNVGQSVRVDCTLQPGTQSQTVTVNAGTPLVNTTSTTLGGSITTKQITNLPLNGRNYQYLVTLRPGVEIQPGGGPWTTDANNTRPDDTEFLVDGVNNTSWYDSRSTGNDSSPFTDAATILPVTSIQSFDEELNPGAQYGWRDGAIINVGINTGTNRLHGSLYAFGRDVAWDARNTFNEAPIGGNCPIDPSFPSACNKLPTQMEQYGATLGGPILRNKLFYFGNFEAQRSTLGNNFAVSIPQTGVGAGPQFSEPDAITALQKAGYTTICTATATSNCLSQQSLDLLGCTGTASVVGSYTCTGGIIAGDPTNSTTYSSTYPIYSTSNNGIVKIDYTINSKNTINGTFFDSYYTSSGQDHATTNPAFLTIMDISAKFAEGDWVYVPNSKMVNDFRFGLAEAAYGVNVADSNVFANGQGGLCTPTGCGGSGYPLDTGTATQGPTAGGMPPIILGGFGAGLGNQNAGRPDNEGPSPFEDYQDNVSYLWGKHTLNFGGEFIWATAEQNVDNKRGNAIAFNGQSLSNVGDCGGYSCPLEDFFAGAPSFGNTNVGNSFRQMHWNMWALYIEDHWQVSKTLMLSMGLRYEYAQPIKEIHNLYANFDPSSPTGLIQQGQPGEPALWSADPKDIAPRMGFDWNTNGKGTMVVRGGIGIYYNQFIGRYVMDNAPPTNGSAGNVAQNPTAACTVFFSGSQTCASVGGTTLGGTINFGAPTFVSPQLNWNGVVFPQGGLACTPDSQCSLFSVIPSLSTPYTVSYDLGMQRQLDPNLSLDVSYVGNISRDLLSPSDINQCAPNSNGNCVRPYGNQFPNFEIINRLDNFGISNYNSLQVTLTQRTSHGLNYLLGYTYGHGLDSGSLNLNEVPPQNSLNRSAEYGSSDFDMRNRFTAAITYNLPGMNGFAQLLKGWQLNTIVTLQSGQPWLVLDKVDGFATGGNPLSDFSGRWDFFGNPSDFKSGPRSIMFCSGPTAGGCSQTSGRTGQSFCNGASGVCNAGTSTSLWAKCLAVAPDMGTLNKAGCYVAGNSVMVPPTLGTYGTMGRNIFRDSGFKDMDLSIFKNFSFHERYTAQFRVETFNTLNHPNYANPYGSSDQSYLGNDPSSPSSFGCGCATPDVMAGNPIIGSGSSRVMQLGFTFNY
ncbi:MAG: carboxypeptidase regulatory-like domain-containing protein [Acidobacteriota bacterium]